MASRTWFSYIESTVYSRVKKYLESEYGTITVTTDEISTAPTSFPTVEVRELEPVERGQTLKGVNINAMLETIQVRVFTKDKATAQKVCRLVTVVMKNNHFDATGMFYITKWDSDIYMGVARFRRMIGADDSDIVLN